MLTAKCILTDSILFSVFEKILKKISSFLDIGNTNNFSDKQYLISSKAEKILYKHIQAV